MDGTKDGHLDFESINPLFDLLLLMSTDHVANGKESLSMTELRKMSMANAKSPAEGQKEAGEAGYAGKVAEGDAKKAAESESGRKQEGGTGYGNVAAKSEAEASTETVVGIANDVALSSELGKVGAERFHLRELELIFLSLDADLSGVVEFDEFLVFAELCRMIKDKPKIIHDFRVALQAAIVHFEEDMINTSSLTDVDYTHDDIVRLGPDAMEALILALQEENNKLKTHMTNELMSGRNKSPDGDHRGHHHHHAHHQQEDPALKQKLEASKAAIISAVKLGHMSHQHHDLLQQKR